MTPNEDIVVRAKNLGGNHDDECFGPWSSGASDCLLECAAEIERLRADNARLQENLSISIGQTERLIKEKDAWLEERSLLVAIVEAADDASTCNYSYDPTQLHTEDCGICPACELRRVVDVYRSAYPEKKET